MAAAAKVYVQGSAFNSITQEVFRDYKYDIAFNLKDSDIVVWTGGEDIYPGLYGEKAIRGTYYDKERDHEDLKAVEEAVAGKKFLVGICRGAQLLNCVPNGGKLWQHVDNHGGRVHPSFDCISGKWVMTNSVHHQMMRPTDDAEIICWALESHSRFADKDVWKRPKNVNSMFENEKDIEVLWYPKTRSLLFQGHPEFGHDETTKYFFNLLDIFYNGRGQHVSAK